MQEQENRMSVINRTIDKICAKYDMDKNGSLQRDEVKIFVTDKIQKVKNEGDKQARGDIKEPTEEEIEEAFKKFDKDNNANIEKQEMVSYVIKALGLEEV